MHRGLGTPYTLNTDLPLLPRVTVDVPLAQMAEEAAPAFWRGSRPQMFGLLAGGLLLVVVGSVVGNLIVPGVR